MIRKLLVSAIAISALSSASYAQAPAKTPADAAAPAKPGAMAPADSATTTPAKTGAMAPTNAATTSGAATSTPAGLRVANTATLKVKYATMKPADIMSSKLVGITVYNNQNENLGEIEDLVIDNGKTITAVVVSVGGFLGIGESYVAIDPTTIVLNDKDGTWRAFVDTSKDNLKAAPKFSYSKTKH